MSRKDYVCCIVLLAVVEILGDYKVTDKLHEIRLALKEALQESKEDASEG